MTTIYKLKSLNKERGLLNDEELAKFLGKSKRQMQNVLREMQKDEVGSKFISKLGGRSTDPLVAKAYLLWREEQKYKARKESFSYIN